MKLFTQKVTSLSASCCIKFKQSCLSGYQIIDSIYGEDVFDSPNFLRAVLDIYNMCLPSHGSQGWSLNKISSCHSKKDIKLECSKRNALSCQKFPQIVKSNSEGGIVKC